MTRVFNELQMNFLKNKKAVLALETIILIILIMFSGAIIIWWMTGVNTDFSREICKTSVITAENTMLLKADSPFQLQCFTRTVQIEQGDKEIKPKKRLYRFQVDSQKELEKVISEEIAGCWLQMGEGERNPFGAYANWGQNTRCVVCSEISFDSEIVKDYQYIDVSGYMKSQNYNPVDVRNIDKPYRDILPLENIESRPLETSQQGIAQDYSVVFVLGQTNPLISWQNFLTHGIYGYLSILGFFENDFAASIVVAPSGELEGKCDKLY